MASRWSLKVVPWSCDCTVMSQWTTLHLLCTWNVTKLYFSPKKHIFNDSDQDILRISWFCHILSYIVKWFLYEHLKKMKFFKILCTKQMESSPLRHHSHMTKAPFSSFNATPYWVTYRHSSVHNFLIICPILLKLSPICSLCLAAFIGNNLLWGFSSPLIFIVIHWL